MAVRLSALRTLRTLLPRNIIIFMFLCWRLSKPQDLVWPEDTDGKNSNDNCNSDNVPESWRHVQVEIVSKRKQESQYPQGVVSQKHEHHYK
jgi:hypothetical protein